jgi:pSer/pThr/pTyr-binding forkhead associated (FHA) protein
VFCEKCGYDFNSTAATWEVVVEVDQSWFGRSGLAESSPPPASPERVIALNGAQLQIGRDQREQSRPAPDIPLDDPGVSRKHAVLERLEDGSYAVTDTGSTNGTFVNDESSPISRDVPVRLGDNDRIRLGAWTMVTLRLRPTPQKS